MLSQTLTALKKAICDLVDEEKHHIEEAYSNLEEGESLSIAFPTKITPPDKIPRIDLQVDIKYAVEVRKIRKNLKINENQMEMEFKEKEEKTDYCPDCNRDWDDCKCKTGVA